MAVANKIDTPGYNGSVNIMIRGISLQVVSLFLFSVYSLDLVFRIRRILEDKLKIRFARLCEAVVFRGFLWALAVEVVTVLIRSTCRITELSGGFNGPLFNQQFTFMILEGMMMSICAIATIVFHPGIAFKGRWVEATWSLRGREKKMPEMEERS